MRFFQNLKTHLYTLYLALTCTGGLAAIAALLNTPASEKNRIIGNISLLQLLVAGFHLIIILVLLYITWKYVQGAPRFRLLVDGLEGHPQRWLASLVVGIAVAWVLFSLDFVLPHSMSAYLERLKYQIVWLRGLALGWLILWWLRNLSRIQLSGDQRTLMKSLLWLPALITPGLVIWITGVGMSARFTDPPAVRFNYTQLVIVILSVSVLALLAGMVKSQSRVWMQANWLRYLLVPGLWLLAAVTWSSIPFTGSFNALGPYPPIGDLVPFADSIRFDLPGQSALVGMGFDRGLWVDNPMYSLFLMILRAIAGQEYQRVMFLQVLVLALTPVFIYLIGRQLGSPVGGLGAALLVIIRDSNILSQIKDHYWLIPVKVMATEPFVTLILVIAIYFLIRWLNDPSRHIPLYLAGAFFGFSTLVRHNTWFFLLALLLVVYLRQRKDFRRALLSLTLVGVFIGAAILPWMWRTQQVFGSPFYMVIRFMGTIDARYPGQSLLAPTPAGGTQPGEPAVKVAKSMPASELTPQASDGQVASFLTGHLFFHYANSYYLLPGLHLLPGEEVLTVFPKQLHQAWRQAPLPVAALYLAWWGFLTWLVAFGIVKSMKRCKLAGLLPFIFLLSYTLGNVAAGTSGSRYSQPLDWVILTYLAIGFFEMLPLHPQHAIAQASVQPPQPRNQKRSVFLQATLVWLGVFLVGSLLLAADRAFPQRYRDPGQAGDLPAIHLEYADRIDAFSSGGSGEIYEGRLIWSMYNKQTENNPFVQDAFDGYDRLTFKLVGDPNLPGRGAMFILPLGMDDWLDEFVAGRDVLVLACPSDPNQAAQVHALGVMLHGQPQMIESTIPCQKP